MRTIHGWSEQERIDLERRLDRDDEREPVPRRRTIPLDERGGLKTWHERTHAKKPTVVADEPAWRPSDEVQS